MSSSSAGVNVSMEALNKQVEKKSVDSQEPSDKEIEKTERTPSSGTAVKSNNPFRDPSFIGEHNSKEFSKPEYLDVSKYPFKTSNRILDDICWSIPYRKCYFGSHNVSLLNRKPIEYAQELSKLCGADPNLVRYDVLILNNVLDYAPSSETVHVQETSQVLTILRGLITRKTEVNHFRVCILHDAENFENLSGTVGKHDYHIIPREEVPKRDLEIILQNTDSCGSPHNMIDDAFFKTGSKPRNHTLRVSLFSPEFLPEDLQPLYNQEVINERYTEEMQKHSELDLLSQAVPNPLHCFKTLVKVLRGPVLLGPDQNIKTINANNPSLRSMLDINLLFNKLSFTIMDNELIPPVVNSERFLRESYIRKILEVIYLATKLTVHPNDYQTNFTYSENMSLIFRHLNEADKHLCQTIGRQHETNRLPSYISLSATTFFPDDYIIMAFENTVASDPSNRLYYVDALRNILHYASNAYNSGTKVRNYVNYHTQNGELYGTNDYYDALRGLGIDITFTRPEQIHDDTIISVYLALYKNDPKNYCYYNRLITIIGCIRKSKYISDFLAKEVIPISVALDQLNIEELTEDEVVITAFEFKLEDTLISNEYNSQSGDIILLKKSLVSVALNRKSYLLLNYAEQNLADYILTDPDIPYDEALKTLDCDTLDGDLIVVQKFQAKFTKASEVSEITLLRSCLIQIAGTRSSKLLTDFSKTGFIDPSSLPAENWPAGLLNIGNTCYLNSLLQYYFCIEPLRNLVISFKGSNIDLLKNASRKIGGRKVEYEEIQRSNQFMFHLGCLYEDMIHSPARYVEPSKELGYLAFLPLSLPVSFVRETEKGSLNSPIVVDEQPLPDSSGVLPEVSDAASVEELESVDNPTRLSNSMDEADDSKDRLRQHLLPIAQDQIEGAIEIGRQQDVTECIENVIFQIETTLEPKYLEEDGEQFDIIKQLFYGKIKQVIRPLGTEGKDRESVERFFSLIINVSEKPQSIYDSLDNYFNEDVMELDEGPVKKILTICELPDMLQFHVQRVLFDREKLRPYKSLEPIPLSETIYLDRYLETRDRNMLCKKEEVFQWKSEVKELQAKRSELTRIDGESNLSIIDSLEATKKYIESKIIPSEAISVNLEVLLMLQSEIDRLKSLIVEIDRSLDQLKTKITNQFNGYNEVDYSIFAIFIHRGEASYGHYWVYIRDFEKNIFRKYNDEIVTEVPLSEVMNHVEGDTATPYYIVYVKGSLKYEYVRPLKRIISN